MKKVFFICSLLLASLGVSAQEEATDSVNSVEVDTVAAESMGEINAIRLKESKEAEWTNRYSVLKKNGKYGICDLTTGEKVTDVEYDELRSVFRKEIDGEFYTYFIMRQGEQQGIIGIAEETNEFITIMLPSE